MAGEIRNPYKPEWSAISAVDAALIRSRYHAQQHHEKVRNFKASRAPEEKELSVGQQTFKKERVALKAGQSLDITINQNLTHDTTLVWHTTGKDAIAAYKMGLLRPQTLTAKAIKELGRYDLKVVNRAIKDKIEGLTQRQKNDMRAQAQLEIEHTQDLELHLGWRIDADEVNTASQKMLANLKIYDDQQVLSGGDVIYRQQYSRWRGIATWDHEFELARIASQDQAHRENKRAAERLRKRIQAHQNDAAWLQSTGNQAILDFVEERTIYAIKRMQGLNQFLTHFQGSGAYLRGDLNSRCEDALKAVHDHLHDFHTPLTKLHQLRFADTDKVAVRSEVHTDGSTSAHEEFMLGVSKISGDNSTLRPGPLRRTVMVRWLHWRSFFDFNNPYEASIFKSRGHFGRFCWNKLLSPALLLDAAIFGKNAYRAKSWCYPPEEPEVGDKTDYYALTARLKKQTSIAVKVGLLVHKIFSHLIVEGLLFGLHDGWKKLKRFPQDVALDFQNSEQPIEAVLKDIRTELQALAFHDNSILGHDLAYVEVKADVELMTYAPKNANLPVLIKQGDRYWFRGSWTDVTNAKKLVEIPHGSELFKQFRFSNEEKIVRKGDPLLSLKVNAFLERGHDLHQIMRMTIPPAGEQDRQLEEKKQEEIDAYPEFSLNPHHSNGMANGLASGGVGFIDMFAHHMFAKHAFTAAASTTACVFSFLAFLSPALAVQLFGKGYTKFLQDQGYIWTKDALSASMAGSFTNFKLVGAIIEGIEHGPDSWLSKGLSYALKDPAKTMTLVTLAWLVGHALVFWVNIPGISETMKHHIGDPKELSEIFGGAKAGIIAYHLVASPHGNKHEARSNYIDECVNNFRALKEKQGMRGEELRIKTQEFRALLEKMLTSETLAQVQSQIALASQQPKRKEEHELAFMLQLATNKNSLARLSPETKAKVQHQLRRMAATPADATAIDKYIDPEKYSQKSTLRGFLGRAINYAPTLLRCLPLSLFAGLAAGSWESFKRPWRDLGFMLQDDFTSTTVAVIRLLNKTLECVFDRMPRTVADIVVNSMLGRVISYFGYHGFTRAVYDGSAKADILKERIAGATTFGIWSYLGWKNTAPHPELGLRNMLKGSVAAQAETMKSPTAAPVVHGQGLVTPKIFQMSAESKDDAARNHPALPPSALSLGGAR